MFLGDDLLAWLVLALGGALVVGNVVAIMRPPARPADEQSLDRAPLARSLLMAGDRPDRGRLGAGDPADVLIAPGTLSVWLARARPFIERRRTNSVNADP